jgi:hypothetical protein
MQLLSSAAADPNACNVPGHSLKVEQVYRLKYCAGFVVAGVKSKETRAVCNALRIRGMRYIYALV